MSAGDAGAGAMDDIAQALAQAEAARAAEAERRAQREQKATDR